MIGRDGSARAGEADAVSAVAARIAESRRDVKGVRGGLAIERSDGAERATEGAWMTRPGPSRPLEGVESGSADVGEREARAAVVRAIARRATQEREAQPSAQNVNITDSFAPAGLSTSKVICQTPGMNRFTGLIS